MTKLILSTAVLAVAAIVLTTVVQAAHDPSYGIVKQQLPA